MFFNKISWFESITRKFYFSVKTSFFTGKKLIFLDVLFSLDVRGREREREIKRQREREKEREGGRDKETEREREREKETEGER